MKKITTILLVVLLVLTCVTMFACNKFDTEGAQLALNSYIFKQDGEVVSGEFVLPGKIGGFDATWTSSDECVKLTEIPASEGIERQYAVSVSYPDETKDVILTVSLSEDVKKSFTVIVNPLTVTDFINAFTFEQERATVFEDFALDQSVSFAGKTATITWSVDDEYKDYIEISEDGKTCHVYPTSLNPTVRINATFNYNGDTETKKYRMTVSEVREHLQDVDYWYSNTGVGMAMKGYVVEIATAFSGSFNNVSLYIVDEDFCSGYYLYRVGCDAATAEKLVPGAPVICTGTTNQNYNGLIETNAGGTIVIDDTREKINIEEHIHAIDNEIIGDLFSANYHQSTLVSLTNWKVTKVEETIDASSSTNRLFTIEKAGAKVLVVASKYMEGAYTKANDNATWNGIVNHDIAVGDIVTVTGVLGNYNGHQITIRSINDVKKGGTEDPAGTTYPGTTAGEAVKAIDKLFEDNGLTAPVVAIATEITLPTIDGATIAGRVLGGNAVAVADGKLTVTPGKLENACVRFDITVGDFSTVIFRYIKSADLDDQGKVEMEAQQYKIELEAITKNTVFELPTAGSIFGDIVVTWAFAENSAHDCATIEGNVLKVTLPDAETSIQLVATFTLNGATETAEFPLPVSQRRALENKVTGAELSTIPALNEIGAGITSGESADKYLVIGYVDEVASTQYGNMYIVDAEGNRLYVYGTYSFDGSARYDAMAVKPVAGDVVVLYGAMTSYKSSPQMKNGWVMQINDTVYGNVSSGEAGGEEGGEEGGETPDAIPAPVAGTYKMYLVQANLSKTLYWDGTQDSSERFATTEDANAAAIITIAKAGENAYTLKIGEKFIELYYIPNTTSDRPHLVDEATGTWAWDGTLGVFTWNLEGTLHYLGTYNSFTTISPSELTFISGSNAANIGVSQFVCQYEAVACTHEFDNNCDNECNLCGEANPNYVAGHVYDNACDAVCNECEEARTPADHVDAEAPKCACDVCGAALDHVDTNSDNKCDNCEANIIPLCTGDHTYTDECDAECDVCPFVREDAPHKFENACDGECECGETRTPADHVDTAEADCKCDVCGADLDHQYDNACDANCNVCDEARTPADHVYTHNGDASCNVCGETRTIAAPVNQVTGADLSTIPAILEIGAAKAHNTYTTDKYLVIGYVDDVYQTTYGNMHIVDENGNILTVYGTYNNDGTTRYDALTVKPVAGDVVVIYGVVGQFNGTPQIKNGWIMQINDTVLGNVHSVCTEFSDATCTEPAKCLVCGKANGEALGHTDVEAPKCECDVCETALKHVDEDANSVCDICEADLGDVEEDPSPLATFDFGEKIAPTTHADGKDITEGKSYTDGEHTLTLTGISKVYDGGNDEQGNKCLKLGTSSAVGTFTFTVSEDVNKVVIYVAGYKAKTSKISINGGSAQQLTTSCNDGEYVAIEIDTTVNKTITFATVSGATRCMIDAIEFWA